MPKAPQKKLPKKLQAPQFEPLEQPISVFVSSAQVEFEQIRQDLKSDIDALSLRFTRLFRAKLVEKDRGTKIDRDIEKGIEKCDIYILLLGDQYSDITRDEFLKAWKSGVQTYVYIYLKPKGISPKSKRCPTHEFLFNDILPKQIRVKGFDKPYRAYGRLLDDVFADLAYCVAELVHESVQVRKVIGR